MSYRPCSTEGTASLSIRYEIISDSGVSMIPYSFSAVFIIAFISYRIHRLLRVNGRPIRYENVPDSFESDTVYTRQREKIKLIGEIQGVRLLDNVKVGKIREENVSFVKVNTF